MSAIVTTDLNKRYTDILKKLVEVYIETGAPVGSRTLSKALDNTLSPATIRNVMADLEDWGILCSNHASSGRKPTDKGWRIFVDGLIESDNLQDIEKQILLNIKKNAIGRSIESILETASDTLSKLSHCVSLVAMPTFSQVIKHIEFILLSPGKAIVILVNDCGLVENRLIDLPNYISSSVLEQVTRYINTKFIGMTLNDIKEKIQKDVDYQKEGIDKIAKGIVEKGLGFISTENNDKLIIKGQSNLINKPDELSILQDLLKKVDEQQTIQDILEKSIAGTGVKIFIGAETSEFELAGCSMIVSSYNNSKKSLVGALGVIGPTRLRYSRIIPLVDYTAKLISSLIG